MSAKNLVLALGMALVVAAGFVLARIPSGAEPAAKKPAAPGGSEPPVTESQAAPPAPNTSPVQQQQALALAREVLTALDDLEGCAQRWDEQVVPLLTDAQGTLLTYDATIVRKFSTLYRRVDSEQIRNTIVAMRGTVQEFAGLLEAVRDDSYSPNDQFLANLRQTKQLVDTLRTTCRDAHRQIDELLLAAQRRVPAPDQITLEQAMAQQDAAETP
jgi:hypothetical protein